MAASGPVDVALLSLATTPGLRRADAAFAALVREAGASCQVVEVQIGRAGALRRHPALTDAIEALAARRTARRLPAARAVVISTTTAAFAVRPAVPHAIRFDAPAALNRPGAAGLWQRAAERRSLARARLLLPWSAEAAAAVGPIAGPEVVPVGVPIERVPATAERPVDVATYAGYPYKRGLDVLCAAWAAAGAPGRLVVAGIEPERGRAWLRRCAVDEPPGIEWVGRLAREDWLALLGRTRVYASAARFEDHGIAQLEALSAGAALACVPTPGPNPPLSLARRLAPELVADEPSAGALARALRAGLALSEDDRRAYAVRADALLAEHRPERLRELVAAQVLPALGVSPATSSA